MANVNETIKLFSDVISYKKLQFILVIFPSIELICDPDFLNQKLISYLTNVQHLSESIDLNQKFSYAASYEDFIKIIKSSKNVDEIKQFHYKIKNEILQATLINDFKGGKFTDNVINSVKSMSASNNATSSNANSNSSSVNNNSGYIAIGSSSFYASFSSTRSIDTDNSNLSKTDTLRSIYLKRLKTARLICERRLESLKSSMSTNEKMTSELNLEKNFQNRKVKFPTKIKIK